MWKIFLLLIFGAHMATSDSSLQDESPENPLSLKEQFLKILQDFSLLSLLEIRAAFLSFLLIIIGFLAFFIMGLSLWGMLLFIIAHLLKNLGFNFYAMMGLLVTIQILMIIPVWMMIRNAKKKLLLPNIRKALDILMT